MIMMMMIIQAQIIGNCEYDCSYGDVNDDDDGNDQDDQKDDDNDKHRDSYAVSDGNVHAGQL